MLSEATKQEIQSAYSKFIASKNFRPRKNQKIMIAEIARKLASSLPVEERPEDSCAPVAVIEAGTGIGKTIAYLTAVLPIARELDKRVVISTATVALQEQILVKDLPELHRHSGLKFSFALAKGRGRYLCTSKLMNLLSSQDDRQAGLFDSDQVVALDKYLFKRFDTLKRKFFEGEWDGDKDQLEEEVPEQHWRMLTANHFECGGRRCQFIDDCPFFKARNDMQEVDCIVANHDLVLSDLALGGGIVLTPPSETIFVFDEAHQLPEKAINHFAHHLNLNTTEQWLPQFSQELTQCSQGLPWEKNDKQLIESVSEMIKDVQEQMTLTQLLLKQILNGEEQFRFQHGQLPLELVDMAKALAKITVKMSVKLDTLVSSLQELEDQKNNSVLQAYIERWQSALGQAYRRILAMSQLWQGYANPDNAQQTPHARWLKHAEAKGEDGLNLYLSPITGEEILRNYLWQHCFAAVVTSATLSNGGEFSRFQMQSGLGEEGIYCSLSSPFDYQNVATLLVPAQATDPAIETEHLYAIVDYLHDRVNLKEGTLVLFNSQRQMDLAYEELSSVFQDFTLVQGRQTKQVIISAHKERIEAGEGSMIFGLASFAEGIDLPGEYLSHVVIARIPFSVPSDPVSEALNEWLEKNNRNPFYEVSIPDASMRLVQACGRLIRSESDTGKIALLDRRIVTKSYGTKILKSLPPFKVVVEPVS